MKKKIILGIVASAVSLGLTAQDCDTKRTCSMPMDDLQCAVTRAARTDGMVALPYNCVVELTQALDKMLGKAARPDAPTLSSPAFPITPFDCADIDLIRRCVCLIKQQLAVICTKVEFIIEELSVIEEQQASCCAAILENFSVVEQQIQNIAVTICDCVEASNSAQSSLLVSIFEEINNNILATVCDCVASNIENVRSDIASCCDTINNNIATCCDRVVSDLASCCETIGNLNDQGSCFDNSLPDLTAAINNANLTVIQWLKTIMLELRGCSCPSS